MWGFFSIYKYNIKVMVKDKLKGGLSDKMSKQEISNKFKVSIQKVDKELKMGTDIEMEHVNSRRLAKEIAMDHLVEIPDYYTRLKKMEKEASKKWNVKESVSENITRLLRESVRFETMDETSDVITYKIFYNNRECGMLGLAPVTDMDNTLELTFIGLDQAYKSITRKVIVDVVGDFWVEFKDINRILLSPTAESKAFWHKIGAIRLNDDFLMLDRGH